MKNQTSSPAIFRSITVIDLITVLYLLITGIFIMYNYSELRNPGHHLLVRLGIFIMIVVLAYAQSKSNLRLIELLHWIYPLLLLTYLFRETAYMNHLFYSHYLDPWIVSWEEKIFGFLPAIAFSEKFREAWFSELLNFGYFSYYFMTIGIALMFYFKYPEEMERVLFILMTAFFTYYLFYIFFPTEGPMYFLQPPLNERVSSGVFSHLVNLADIIGDGKTGAFPSSHVGMAVIYVILTYKKFPKLFWVISFLTVLICFATVYIKAHYFLDALAGLLSAPVIFVISNWLYSRFLNLKEKSIEIAL
ncbi:MAG: phosphatase PAP2 family protein [Bacteroidales bacterium]|nr:phosphatase PAP2 family protein [Bacteroidales bacterium]